MAVEYDLVVVGATAAAEVAAIAAAQAHARVAWVAPTRSVDPLVLLREGAWSFRQQIGQSPNPNRWRDWTDILQTALSHRHAPEMVQSYGVDYLEEPIAFGQDGRVVLTAGPRQLRSRAYLLAMEPEASRPSIPGIDHPKVWRIDRLWEQLRAVDRVWPRSLAILGQGPRAVELSQSLQSLGIAVTLLTGGGALLPHEDQDAAFLLQSYLECAGIQIDNQGSLTEIYPSENGLLLLRVGDCKYSVEALVLAMEASKELPDGLVPLQLQQTRQGIAVNRALQTSIPYVYACGSLIGGYPLPSVANYEAKLAVQNALFEARSLIQYHQVPYAILSNPPLARVGLTEHQAQRYDPQVQVLQQTYKDCDRALFQQAPAGLCKLLVQPDGTLLGAHILGSAAEEIIHLFALAIQQDVRLPAFNTLGYASPTFTAVVQNMAAQWQQRRYDRDRNERWFYQRCQQTR